MSFNTSFLNILRGLDPLDKEYNDWLMYDLSDHSVDGILKSAPYFLQGVKRPQYLIKTSLDYYVARDTKTNTVYMCYKNIMMLDFDKNDLTIDSLLDNLPKDMSFMIYKTERGYHAFCVSRKFEYRTRETVEFMHNYKDLGIDIDYIRFCYIRGFSVRLNKKFNGENKDNYKYITTTNEQLVDNDLKNLVELHITECKKYKKDLNLN